MKQHHRAGRRRSDRGATSSLLVAIIAPGLLLLFGLIVDGGGQLSAVQQAQGIAAQAARAGADASAGKDIGRHFSDRTSPKVAAETYLRDAGADGTVTIANGEVTVHTTVTYQTKFLGLINVRTLRASGEATAILVSA